MMNPFSSDSFGARTFLEVAGRRLPIHSLARLHDGGLPDVDCLPFSLKVLLENLLRHEDGQSVAADDISALADWTPTRGSIEREIGYRPARVLMQDFTGVPAAVDLAAMRGAFAALGGDPARILTVSLVLNSASALSVAALGTRLGRALPLAFGMAMTLAGVAVLMLRHDLYGYVAGTMLTVGLWNIAFSFQMGLIASADITGKVAVLIPAAVSIGGALGPGVAGTLAEGGSYMPIYLLVAIATAVSLAIFLALARRLSQFGLADSSPVVTRWSRHGPRVGPSAQYMEGAPRTNSAGHSLHKNVRADTAVQAVNGGQDPPIYPSQPELPATGRIGL